MRRTKIVCTIGPGSEDPPLIREMILAGMDVARLNFSHEQLDVHQRRIRTIREVSRELKRNVGIMVDTRGPEIRIRSFAAGSVSLTKGELFTLTVEEIEGDKNRVSVTYPGLPADLEPGAVILLDDGLITLLAEKITGSEVCCRVIHGGELRGHKGINLPGTSTNLPAMSEQDRRDIIFAVKQDVDFIAASFIRKQGDVVQIRNLVEEYNGDTRIISKIETREGLDNFPAILQVSDGVMVARGDLGVEIPAEDVPLVQKSLIEKCNKVGKPVITATQMLESMINNPRPTRAEASDVANAIFDGTDAIMLSGETAIGRYPLESVKIMAKIARRTEEDLHYKQILDYFETVLEKTVTDAISYATCHSAHELGAAAIITATHSGHTARMVSKYRPRAPIIAVTPSQRVAASLSLTWGVNPVVCKPIETTDEMFTVAIEAALQSGLTHMGDLVVITAGVPVGVSGTTNLLRVETIGEVIARGTGVGKASVTSRAFVVKHFDDISLFSEGCILVAASTDKHYLSAMEKAKGIITEEGGLTSHAAIVAITLGIPLIVGVEDATGLIEEGELITLDSIRGLVYRGKATVL